MSDGEQTNDALEGGSYEVIRSRLLEPAEVLTGKADQLNARRKETFGGTELAVIGNERVRTENNCVPRDIVQVGGQLLFGYNVFIGLKHRDQVGDVFSLHRFERTPEGGFDLSQAPADSVPGLLVDPGFARDFDELYRYYKDAKLLVIRDLAARRSCSRCSRSAATLDDVKVLRWSLDPDGTRRTSTTAGERDHVLPPPHRLRVDPDHPRGPGLGAPPARLDPRPGVRRDRRRRSHDQGREQHRGRAGHLPRAGRRPAPDARRRRDPLREGRVR